MANKSYASSDVGGDESHYFNDPEHSKDFNSAYQKVNYLITLRDGVSNWLHVVGREDILGVGKHFTDFLGRDLQART